MRPNQLRKLLEAGDPARDGSEPTPSESAALRRRILRAGRRRRPRAWIPITVAATLAVTAVLVPKSRAPETTRERPDPGTSATLETDPTMPDEPDTVHRIQFAAEGGTQVIWVVNPDLSL